MGDRFRGKRFAKWQCGCVLVAIVTSNAVHKRPTRNVQRVILRINPFARSQAKCTEHGGASEHQQPYEVHRVEL
jgi:hypothetical protein